MSWQEDLTRGIGGKCSVSDLAHADIPKHPPLHQICILDWVHGVIDWREELQRGAGVEELQETWKEVLKEGAGGRNCHEELEGGVEF